MSYLRISIMEPKRGAAPEVEQINRDLVDFYRQQKNCIECYLIVAADQSGEIGRVSLWESKAAADGAANAQHSLALRSRLHQLVEPGRSDRSFLTA